MRDERGSAADGGAPDAPDDDSAARARESAESRECAESRESAGGDASLGSAEGDRQRPVVRRRSQLSRDERAFLERFRQDMPPHHDSSWG